LAFVADDHFEVFSTATREHSGSGNDFGPGSIFEGFEFSHLGLDFVIEAVNIVVNEESCDESCSESYTANKGG